MEAKDRAKELVEKFKDYAYVEWHGGEDEMTNEIAAKECALICVDEIISALKKNNPEYLKNTYWHPIDFYKQVIEEINKL